MKIKTFNKATNCPSPKVTQDVPSMGQVAKGLFFTGVLALALGSFIPEEETTYRFNGPEMDNATLEDNTYTITFQDGSAASVTKEELAQEDLTYFGYNSYPLGGHQCSVTPRQEVGFKDLFICSGGGLIASGAGVALSSLSAKRKNKKEEEKEQAREHRQMLARQKVYKSIHTN